MALCDHDSTDNSYLLPELFGQRGIDGVIVDRAPKPRQTEFNNSIDEQLACMDQCWERYRNDTDWFIIAVSHCLAGLCRQHQLMTHQPIVASTDTEAKTGHVCLARAAVTTCLYRIEGLPP